MLRRTDELAELHTSAPHLLRHLSELCKHLLFRLQLLRHSVYFTGSQEALRPAPHTYEA